MLDNAFQDSVWSWRVIVDVISVTNASGMILGCSDNTLMSSCKSYFAFMDIIWFASRQGNCSKHPIFVVSVVKLDRCMSSILKIEF